MNTQHHPHPWTEGYTHLYTGNGKGKTTAAFGLALRALAAGANVFIGQFVKSMRYGECSIAEAANALGKGQCLVELFGNGCTLLRNPTEEDRAAARAGIARCLDILKSGDWHMVILDELTIALHLGLIADADIKELLQARPPHVELIITGRYAPDWLIARCDLVTDMQEVRHYYQQGVEARVGIER